MSLPPRTIVYFHYRRDETTLVPTTGGLRDAKMPENDHPVNHSWIEELSDEEIRLNLAVEGFEIRPMPVAVEHIEAHKGEWEKLARTALAEHLPDHELIEPPAEEA